MLRNIKVKNFRGVKAATIDGFAHINVLTGMNGSGKTSLLEAVFLNAGGGNPRLAISMYNFRNESALSFGAQRLFKNLFLNLNVSEGITISADIDTSARASKKMPEKRFLEIEPIFEIATKSTRSSPIKSKLTGLGFRFIHKDVTYRTSLGWNLHPKVSKNKKNQSAQATDIQGLYINAEKPGPLIPGTFVSPYFRDLWEHVHEQITELVREKREDDLIKVMKLIDPRVDRLLPLMEDGLPIVYIDLGGEQIPLPLMGSGFVHLTFVALGAYGARDGILVVDEVETGLHFSVLPKLFEFLIRVSQEYNIQVFLATHSMEVIRSFAETARARDFRSISLFNLAKRDGLVSSTKFTLSEIESAEKINAELR